MQFWSEIDHKVQVFIHNTDDLIEPISAVKHSWHLFFHGTHKWIFKQYKNYSVLNFSIKAI